jgi:hypothetical protein
MAIHSFGVYYYKQPVAIESVKERSIVMNKQNENDAYNDIKEYLDILCYPSQKSNLLRLIEAYKDALINQVFDDIEIYNCRLRKSFQLL